MGVRKAKEMLFTGGKITAQEALQIGMVNRVVSDAELFEYTLALAQQVAKAPPFGLHLIKRSLNRTSMRKACARRCRRISIPTNCRTWVRAFSRRVTAAWLLHPEEHLIGPNSTVSTPCLTRRRSTPSAPARTRAHWRHAVGPPHRAMVGYTSAAPIYFAMVCSSLRQSQGRANRSPSRRLRNHSRATRTYLRAP